MKTLGKFRRNLHTRFSLYLDFVLKQNNWWMVMEPQKGTFPKLSYLYVTFQLSVLNRKNSIDRQY